MTRVVKHIFGHNSLFIGFWQGVQNDREIEAVVMLQKLLARKIAKLVFLVEFARLRALQKMKISETLKPAQKLHLMYTFYVFPTSQK